MSYIPKMDRDGGFLLQTRLNTVKIAVYDKKEVSKEQLAISNEQWWKSAGQNNAESIM